MHWLSISLPLPVLGLVYKLNHNMWALFTVHYIFRVLPCGGVFQYPVPFSWLHNIPLCGSTTRVYPFISRWTLVLFPPFGCYK